MSALDIDPEHLTIHRCSRPVTCKRLRPFGRRAATSLARLRLFTSKRGDAGLELSKLHTKRHGPYRVVNHIGTVYTLENLVTNKLRNYHVKSLLQYSHDEVNADVIKVAKIDQELRDITQVINHRFKGTKKTLSNLELLLV